MTHLIERPRTPNETLPAYGLTRRVRVAIIATGDEATVVRCDRRSWLPEPRYRIDRDDLAKSWYRESELERID